MHFFGQVRYSDSGSSLPSARNTSVMIPNMSVNREVQFFVRENQAGLNSVDIVAACSSVAFEQNPV